MASPVSAPLPAVPRKDEPPSTSAMPANPSQPGSKPGIGWKPMSDDDIVASVAGDAPTDTAVVAAQTITPVQAVSTLPAQHVQPTMPAAPMPAALPAMASPVSAPLPAVPRKDEPPSSKLA